MSVAARGLLVGWVGGLLAGCAGLQPAPAAPPEGSVRIHAARSYLGRLGPVSGGHGEAISSACDGGACEFRARLNVAVRPLRFGSRSAADGALILAFPSGERRADGTVVLDVKAARAELCAQFGRSPRRCVPMKITRARAKLIGEDLEVHALLSDPLAGRIEAHLYAASLAAAAPPPPGRSAPKPKK